MPGDNVEMMCDIYNPIAIENGQRFNIREGTYALGLGNWMLKVVSNYRGAHCCDRLDHEGS